MYSVCPSNTYSEYTSGSSNCINCNFVAHDPDLVTLIPTMKKFQAFGRIDFEVNNHLNLYVEGLYADARAKENTAAINILARDLRRRVQLATAGAFSPAPEAHDG